MWQQKILVSTAHFNKDDKTAPVFFYAGNEGAIENFFTNSGFVTETLAKEFGAAVIFAEHRFFGDSMPGGSVEAAKMPEVYKYLTTEQAQQDYVNLINYMKNPAKDDINAVNFQKLDLAKRPIIVVGGSYGGMLAAWLRMKYPHIFAGALASSAPLMFSPETVSPYAFNEAITNQYKAQNLLCPTFIKAHLLSLAGSMKNGKLYKDISKAYGTCDVIKTKEEMQALIDLTESAFKTMAMVNYPYPTDLMGEIPANPLATVCTPFAKLKPKTKVNAIWPLVAKGMKLVYPNDELRQCFDLASYMKVDNTQHTADMFWEVMACNQFILPQYSNGKTDMFIPSVNTAASDEKKCMEEWGVKAQPDWILEQYGGKNPEFDYASFSNIIFTNGSQDPWKVGGITKQLWDETTTGLYFMEINNATHHYDLRNDHPNDPDTVQLVRGAEITILRTFIDEFNARYTEETATLVL